MMKNTNSTVVFGDCVLLMKKEIFSLPGAKSITNRALLLAALAHGTSVLRNVLESDDTIAFLNAICFLGVKIESHKDALVIHGEGRLHAYDVPIWCDSAGTAARFLLAACAAMPGIYHFDASEQMRQRPMSSLVHVLRHQGVLIDSESLPFKMETTGLYGGDVIFDSPDSSQFVSALLMASPFMKTPLSLQVKGLSRDAFIQMTVTMMRDFGVVVERQSDRYQVMLPQQYSAREYDIEPDMSTASYFFARAALMKNTVTIPHVMRETCIHGDVEFLTVLEQMGCSVTSTSEGISVTGPEQLQGVTVDMNNFSDTFLTLACLAPFAATATTITGLAHTRLQECDRLAVIAQMLLRLKITVNLGEDWIRIEPGVPQAVTVDSHHDHRVAMALSLIGLKTPGLRITHANAVSKTCPDFFARWGANVLTTTE